MSLSPVFAQGLKMGLSVGEAADLARTISQLTGSPEEQDTELFRLLGRMNPSRLQRLELRIVGDTPLLVHRMNDRELDALAGRIPWPRWDEDVGRQHEAAAAAAGMIASH